MPINGAFFIAIKQPVHFSDGTTATLFSSLTQRQVDSLNTVVACFDAFSGAPRCIDDLAYILATCLRECGPGMNLSVEEGGRGRGKAYGLPAGPYNQVYYGRGPCQITWLANYQKAKTKTGIDFVAHPEYMCEATKGVVYMIVAMYAGLFTGKGLRTYIQPNVPTSFAAFGECRRIINGVDHKDEVARNAMAFVEALRVGYVNNLPTPLPPQAPSQGWWSRLRSMFGSKS